MINFFRRLSPFHILWLALFTLVLRAGYLFNPPAKLDYGYISVVRHLLLLNSDLIRPYPFFDILIAGLMVFSQALLLNRLVNHFNLLGKPTFLPALMYITITSLFTPFLVISSPLICNFLLIWMLFKVVGFYKSRDSKGPAYDLGIITAIGSLIYLPFVFFFIIIWIALIVFKPFNWREWITSVLGYVTVFFFLAVYYYLNDKLSAFTAIWAPLATRFPDRISISIYSYAILFPVAFILVLYIIKLQQNYYKSYIQVRKTFQLLFLVFIIGALTFFVKAAFQINHFVLCAVPAAVFFAYYFLQARLKWFYESLYILLVIMIIYFQFNTF